MRFVILLLLFNTVVCVQLEEHFLYSILKNIFLRFWHLTNINFWKIIVYLLCWVMGATPVTSLLSSLKINHLYLSHFTQMERNMFTANTVLSDCIFGGLKQHNISLSITTECLIWVWKHSVKYISVFVGRFSI